MYLVLFTFVNRPGNSLTFLKPLDIEAYNIFNKILSLQKLLQSQEQIP